jgi:hypothetical protein
MTKENLASLLDYRDCERCPLMTDIEQMEADLSGLVVVYGASDDLIEIEGAIGDEGDCYDGGELFIDKDGLLPDFDQIEEEDEKAVVQYWERKRKCQKIIALWCQEDGFAWTYKTRIPHSTFVLQDKKNDDPTYCRGIVFEKSSLK